jgi:sterol desaturase/sphingolipid hydroxylase (fatty acid hydroxylase superfamily)
MSRFPPSFEGNPWTYGFSLFALTLVAAISLALLAAMLLERRHQRHINSEIGNPVKVPRVPFVTSLSLYRFKLGCLLSTIILLTLPRAVVMLAWGEASDRTMTCAFWLNRISDGLALMPFLAFIASHLFSGGAVAHRLGLDPEPVVLKPRWARIRDKVKIAVLAFLISVGVTLYKASV